MQPEYLIEEEFKAFQNKKRIISYSEAKEQPELMDAIWDLLPYYDNIANILLYHKNICLFERLPGSPGCKYVLPVYDDKEGNELDVMERELFLFCLREGYLKSL